MSDAILHQWLEAQCARIPGVRSGLLHLTTGDGKRSIVQWPEKAPRLAELLKAAQLAITHRRLLVRDDSEGRDAASRAAIVALPVSIDDESQLSLAVSFTAADPEYSKRVIAALRAGLASLPRHEESTETAGTSDARPSGQGLEILTRLLATALSQENFKSLATVLTTEIATLLHCDRVSLGFREGRQTRLAGLSNSAEHKPRQALVEALTAAMDEAIDQHATIEFPPPAGQPGRIHLLHRQLAEQHKGGAICTVPLFTGGEAIGALLLERPANRAFSLSEVELCENLASFIAPVVRMQHEISQNWLQQNWRGLKRFGRRLFSRGDLLYKVVPLTLLLLAGAAATISVPFQITANAQVEGAVQRIVSAPGDGFIETVHVRPGDHVKKGQLLLQLEDDALELERRKLEGELAQLKSAYGGALASRDRGELSVVLAQIEEAKARLALIEQQLEKVRLTAPFDAVVIDGDLTQALGAPVNEGDKLLTLAPENDFRVIVDIDEHDIRFARKGQPGRLTLTANPRQPLDIEIRQITPMAQVKESANVFPAEARIVDAHGTMLRPGMVGVARIDAGERSLLWVALRRSIDWLKFRLWVWLG